MPKSRYVASKRDIIIFFIISVFYTILSNAFIFTQLHSSEKNIKFLIFSLLYFLPQVIAIIINAVIKYADINNEKGLKITKILFNIFAFCYFCLAGFIAYVFFELDMDLYNSIKYEKEQALLLLQGGK